MGVKVEDVMTHLVVMLFPHDAIEEAARRLARNRVGGAPVVADGRVVGIVSESDLWAEMPRAPAARAGAKGRGARPARGRTLRAGTVADVMTRDVICTSPATSVQEAALLMERKGVKRLPVVDDEGMLAGIVARADLLHALVLGEGASRP